MNIYEKLANVQSALKAPKGQRNTFGNYNYRSCEDIVEAVKPILKEYGLLLSLTDELCMIGERYYIKATAIVYDIADGGCFMTTAYAREEESKKGMDGSQVTGASSSYARKYALNGLFAIDDTKDSDATNTHGKDETYAAPKKNKSEKTPNQTPRQMLIARLNELGIDVNAFAKANNLNGKTDPETFTRLLKELENA